MRVARALAGLLVGFGVSLSVARAQDTAPAPEQPAPPAQAEPEEGTTGLPKAVEWTFNFDAAWGTFGFANSLYRNPREDIDAHLSDQWFEGSVKPALSGHHKFR